MLIALTLMIAIVLCAFQALRTRQLLVAAIWLACTSALVAALLYTFGAHEVAVIELSVGAGLVTVLFVFGITIAGEDAMAMGRLVPWALGGGLALAFVGLVAWFVLPLNEAGTAVAEPTFSTMLWENRGLDMLVQIGLIFAGVMGILGILAEKETAEERARANFKARQIKPVLPQTPTTVADTSPEPQIKEAHA